jgi:hypothetical protein
MFSLAVRDRLMDPLCPEQVEQMLCLRLLDQVAIEERRSSGGTFSECG